MLLFLLLPMINEPGASMSSLKANGHIGIYEYRQINGNIILKPKEKVLRKLVK